MALKFSGRTPSASLRRAPRVLSRQAAGQKSRSWALRIGVCALLLWVFAVLARGQIDAFSSQSSTRFSAVSSQEAFLAPFLFVGETLRQSEFAGALFWFVALLCALFSWLALSFLGEWRKPPVGFLALLGLQTLGVAFHLANVFAPAHLAPAHLAPAHLAPAHLAPAQKATIEYSIANFPVESGAKSRRHSTIQPVTNAAATNALQNLRLSWQRLSRASQTSVVAGVFLGFCVAWFWGAGSEERAAKWNGPQKAQRFLRKRKVSYRIGGLSLMLLAYAATLLAGAILFGETLALPFFSTVSVAWFSPSVAFIACVLLDAIYLQGRQLWRRLP